MLWLARKAIVAGVLAGLMLPIVLFVIAYGRTYFPGAADAVNPRIFPSRNDRDALINSAWGWYRVIDFANHYLPRDAKVLVFRQNDYVYYGRHRVVRDVDPRMIPIYRLPDKEAAYGALLENGIHYFYVPTYDTPTRYNTPVGDVIADPEMTRLVFEDRGTRLYRLVDPDRRRPLFVRSVIGADSHWTAFDPDHGWAEATFPVAMKAGAGQAAWLHSGRGGWDAAPISADSSLREGAGTYRVRARVSGRGWFRLLLVEYPARAQGSPQFRILRESAVHTDRPDELAVQLRVGDNAGGMRLMMSARGEIRVHGVEMDRVEATLPYGVTALDGIRPLHDVRLEERIPDVSPSAFTGHGHYLVPPSRYLPTPDSNTRLPAAHRVRVETEGTGRATIASVIYDVDGLPRATPLEALFVGVPEASFERILLLPAEAREFRIGVLTSTDRPSLADYLKRWLFRDAPPRRVADGPALTVRGVSAVPAPEALDLAHIRDCRDRQTKTTPGTAVLCRP